MTKDEFAQQLGAVRERVDVLRQRLIEKPEERPQLLPRVFEELDINLEELSVAEEELRQTNEELISAQQTIAAERQRYQDLFDSAPDAYLVTDPTGTIQEANLATAQLVNTQKEFLVGKPITVFVDAAQQTDFFARLTQAGRGEVATSWDMLIQPRDRAGIPVSMHVNAMRDAAGKIIGLRWVARDISSQHQLEEEVGRQKNLYESLLQAQSDLGDGVALVESERIIYANEALARIYGYSVDEIVALPSMYEIIAPEERTRLADQLRNRLGGGEVTTTGHTVIIRKDGQRVDIEYAVKLLRSQERVQLFAIIRDVTERRRTEERLSLDADIIAHIPIGLAVVELEDPADLKSLRIIEINPKTAQIANIKPEELVGKYLTETSPQTFENGTAEIYERVLRTREPVDFGDVHNTNPAVSGEWFSAKIFALSHNRVAVTLEDISERKRAVEAAREVEERFRLLVQRVEDYAIYLIDPDGKIVSWNEGAERIKGYRADEILGQNFSRFYTPEDNARDLPKHTLAVAAEQGRFEQENWRVRKDGSRFWANVLITALRDEKGQLEGYIKITRDITERKRHEEERAARTRQLQALAEAAPVMHAALSPDAAVKFVAEKAREIIGTHQSLAIFTGIEPQAGTIRYAAFSDQFAGYRTINQDPGELEISPIALPDNHPLRLTREESRQHPGAREFAQNAKYPPLSGWLVVPMLGYTGRSIGQIHVSDKIVGDLNADDEAILVELAHAAAVAIENAQLLEEVAASRKNLRILTGRLIDAEEDERRRIARELHDEFGQRVTGLRMQLEIAARSSGDDARKNLREAQSEVTVLLEQVRALSLELRPAVLDDLGLLPALLSLIERYGAHNKVHVDLKQSGLEGQRFPAKIETTVYRVVQESLTNVARHAQAKEAKVRIEADVEVIRLRIEDHGVGFDPNAAGASASTGLPGMRERILFLGGQFVVESAPGQGTRVFGEIPLRQREARADQDRLP